MAKKQVPDTSKAAFKSLIPEKIGEIYLVIMGALFILKRGTFEDIARHLKINKDRVWRRLSEMERLQLIHRPGTKKKLSSGREGYEWELTLKGQPTVMDHSRSIQSIQNKIQQLKLF